MNKVSGAIDEQSLETIKNLDFCLRRSKARTILVGADYPEEGHDGFIHSACDELERLYDRKALIVDLLGSVESTDGPIGRQGPRELDYLYANGQLDGKKLDIYLEENKKYYDVIFVVLDVKRNIQSTRLPESRLDGAILVRTSKSLGLKKSRFVTNSIKDAGIEILGTVLQDKGNNAN